MPPQTTVISREGDDQSISTEETTVIEETPAPVDHNGRVDVAHRIDDDRREEGSEERTQERRDDDEDTTTVNPPGKNALKS